MKKVRIRCQNGHLETGAIRLRRLNGSVEYRCARCGVKLANGQNLQMPKV